MALYLIHSSRNGHFEIFERVKAYLFLFYTHCILLHVNQGHGGGAPLAGHHSTTVASHVKLEYYTVVKQTFKCSVRVTKECEYLIPLSTHKHT